MKLIKNQNTKFIVLLTFSLFSSEQKQVAKTSSAIQYPNLPSAIRPIPHSEEVPIPEPPTEEITSDSEDSDTECEEQPADDFVEYEDFNKPMPLSQKDLNDLVRDLNLTKHQSEVLASRLKERFLVTAEVRISKFRNRSDDLIQYFSYENNLCYCNDINGLFEQLDIVNYEPSQWRLFIDASLYSTKAVLLHIGNKYPSIPVAHSIVLKETYSNLQYILTKINYEVNKWLICADLKVVAILSGLQAGYTKYMCYLCEWDSRAREQHYKRTSWPTRSSSTIGSFNVINEPLVPKQNILLPPLHIKLGLMKQFVKALNQSNPSCLFLKAKFPNLSDAKVKEGIFVGPQIRNLFKDKAFEKTLNTLELNAWKCFKAVCEGFLGKNKDPNYHILIKNLINSFEKLGCKMSLKVHFMHSHVEFFPFNFADISDEHGERFHQDISEMENRYKGKWSPAMLADFCWSLQRDQPEASHKKKHKY